MCLHTSNSSEIALPTVKSYLSAKDYERLKLRCKMQGMTEYRYLKEAILHALEQIKKQGKHRY